jgi:hypothetical protein
VHRPPQCPGTRVSMRRATAAILTAPTACDKLPVLAAKSSTRRTCRREWMGERFCLNKRLLAKTSGRSPLHVDSAAGPTTGGSWPRLGTRAAAVRHRGSRAPYPPRPCQPQ